MLKIFKKFMLATAVVAGAASLPEAAGASVWDDYKALFIKDTGAVVDTYNHNMSHSEGQSYALMFALAFNDQDTFSRVLSFTESKLRDPNSGLHYWAYKPEEADPVSDKNNATDGDLMIAWALMKAGETWGIKDFSTKGEDLAKAIADKCAVDFAGYRLLLPGVDGFYKNSSVIVNPSYIVLPALSYIANRTHDKVFEDLYNDGKRLLEAVGNSGFKVNLVPDWIEVDAQGRITPSTQWPARSSYDAIRVPLYESWDDPSSPLLAPWRAWFGKFGPDNNPAWVNVTTGETANYMMSEGLKAVKTLALGMAGTQEPRITSADDYYNASLKLLSYLAARHF